MIQSSEPPIHHLKIVIPPPVLYSTAPAASFLLRDKYVQILVLRASPPAVEGNGHSSAVAGLNKEKCLSVRPGYAEGPELCEVVWTKLTVLGGPGVAAAGGAGGEPV